MISLIILTAVINTLAQDVSNVDLLASLPSQSLQCSLKFDRNFIATNEELAAAIEALVEENASEESGASRRDRPCDSDEATEADQEDATTEEELQARRALRGGKGRGRGGRRNRDVTLEAGATRPPRGDKPCDSDSDDTTEDLEEDVADEPATEEEVQLRRALRGGKGRGRGGRRNRDVTLEAGATRPPRGDKPCDSDSDDTTEDSEENVADDAATEGEVQLRRALRGGKGRGRGGRRNRDVTLEAGATRPPRGDKPCDSDSDDTTEGSEDVADEPATEELQLRRALRGGKGRGRAGRRNRDVTLEAGATRPPRGDKPCDSDSDDTTEDLEEDVADEPATEEEVQLRRALRGGKGRGRGGRRNRDVTLEAGATRPPRGDKPCDSESDDTNEDPEEDVADEPATEEDVQLRRALRGGKGRGRGGRRNRDVTLEAGATRPPRGDKPCDSDSDDTTEDSESVADEGDNEELQLRRALRGGKGRGRGGRRNRDVTLEAGATRPPRGDKPCDSDSDDTTEDSEADEPATEEDVQLRRALRGGKGRGRGGRRNRDVTLEAGATRPPRGDKPCDSDSDDSSEETGSTDEPVTEESLLRRLLRRGRDSSETDAEVAGETDATDEPCRRRGRGHGRRNRRKDTDTETPEEETDGAARRALGGRGKRSRGLDAAISNGSIDFAGLTGEVVFGEVDEELESVPLTVTVGGTSFNCDVEVRRGNKVSCRAISQDDFHLRVGCEILADEE